MAGISQSWELGLPSCMTDVDEIQRTLKESVLLEQSLHYIYTIVYKDWIWLAAGSDLQSQWSWLAECKQCQTKFILAIRKCSTLLFRPEQGTSVFTSVLGARYGRYSILGMVPAISSSSGS